MPVITIARQLGAGGETVAQRLADVLGWRLLDRAVVERIAEEMEVETEQVEAADERVGGFVERLGQYLAEGLPEMLPATVIPPLSPEDAARAARRIVETAVDEGPAVMVGHGAMCVLAEHPDAMHVFLHAPLELRVRRAMDVYETDQADAEQKIRRSDADRRRYIREHFSRDWLDPTLYHVSLDTGAFALDDTVALLHAAADRRFRPPEASG